MSLTSTSLSQAGNNVNTRYYPVQIKANVRAAQARLTPEQIIAANEFAAKLRAQDAVLLAGPVIEGHVIRIPSWHWASELVREIKSRRGWHFENALPYTLRITLHHHDYTPTITMPTWTIPAEPGRLKAIRAVYEQVFAREIAAARATEHLAPIGRF